MTPRRFAAEGVTTMAVVMLAAACGMALADVRVELAGQLPFPDEARLPDGTPVTVRGLSGLLWLGGERWVAVMDNSDLLVRFSLALGRDGTPERIEDLEAVKLSGPHDFEDLAACPPRLAARIARRRPEAAGDADQWILLVEESTPAIRAVSMADGGLLGTVPLPPVFSTRRPNRGPEALAVEPDGSVIWTANEEALPDDGPLPAPGAGTTVRLVAIEVPEEDGPVDPRFRHYAYAVDPPHAFLRLLDGPVFSGLVALEALGDGRLLVLERSGAPGLPPFENRLFLVDTAEAEPLPGPSRDLSSRPDLHILKQELWTAALGCNLEGMALGPSLRADVRALLAISDNDGLGVPGVLVGFRLTGATSSAGDQGGPAAATIP
jgi:hypothetical protein